MANTNIITSANNNKETSDQLQCDYLVVGAGTANLAFVDTVLSEHQDPNVKFIIVDRNSGPGGHWTTAYPFVRLHQQSCNYGVNSVSLGKTRIKKKIIGKNVVVEPFDSSDRATGEEICSYYENVVKNFVSTNRVRTFFDTEYYSADADVFVEDEGRGKEKKKQHYLKSKISGKVYSVSCVKLVVCETNVIVPSMRKIPFPIHESVIAKPVNGLTEEIKSGKFEKYLVIGAGKTGIDAIVHLLQNNIDPDCISWIISRDVWYIIRDKNFPTSDIDCQSGVYYKWITKSLLDPFFKADSIIDYYVNMEKHGSFARLDPNLPYPKVFKGPTIDTDELKMIRSISNVVRLGRVTSITNEEVVLQAGRIPFSSEDTLVVDCMAFDFYGYHDIGRDFKIFRSNSIHLGPPTHVFNPSLTSSILGYLESKFHDDDAKNRFCYFPYRKYDQEEDCFEYFVQSLHSQQKTMQELAKYKPAVNFILNCRTNHESPVHHGGLLKFLWALFGPTKLKRSFDRVNDVFVQKKLKGFEDQFVGREEVDTKLLKKALRPTTKSNIKDKKKKARK